MKLQDVKPLNEYYTAALDPSDPLRVAELTVAVHMAFKAMKDGEDELGQNLFARALFATSNLETLTKLDQFANDDRVQAELAQVRRLDHQAMADRINALRTKCEELRDACLTAIRKDRAMDHTDEQPGQPHRAGTAPVAITREYFSMMVNFNMDIVERTGRMGGLDALMAVAGTEAVMEIAEPRLAKLGMLTEEYVRKLEHDLPASTELIQIVD